MRIETLVTSTHLIRILIFLFLMMIGKYMIHLKLQLNKVFNDTFDV